MRLRLRAIIPPSVVPDALEQRLRVIVIVLDDEVDVTTDGFVEERPQAALLMPL